MAELLSLIFSLQGLLIVVFALLIIYLIIRRVVKEKDEHFEDRDN